ncbi:MAG: hypothetical protein QXS19_09130 [Candidatus Methanomethylicia archaeon]
MKILRLIKYIYSIMPKPFKEITVGIICLSIALSVSIILRGISPLPYNILSFLTFIFILYILGLGITKIMNA